MLFSLLFIIYGALTLYVIHYYEFSIDSLTLAPNIQRIYKITLEPEISNMSFNKLIKCWDNIFEVVFIDNYLMNLDNFVSLFNETKTTQFISINNKEFTIKCDNSSINLNDITIRHLILKTNTFLLNKENILLNISYHKIIKLRRQIMILINIFQLNKSIYEYNLLLKTFYAIKYSNYYQSKLTKSIWFNIHISKCAGI